MLISILRDSVSNSVFLASDKFYFKLDILIFWSTNLTEIVIDLKKIEYVV